MIFKQTEEGDFQWEENDELIRTGCVLVGPLTHEIGNDTDVRNTFKLICLYFLQVNVAQRLNGENVIVVSRLLLRVWTVAIEWEEHLSPPCHHEQFQTHTTNISKASATLFDNFMSGSFVFAFGGNSITTAIIDIAGNQPSCSGCYLRALGEPEHDDML